MHLPLGVYRPDDEPLVQIQQAYFSAAQRQIDRVENRQQLWNILRREANQPAVLIFKAGDPR